MRTKELFVALATVALIGTGCGKKTKPDLNPASAPSVQSKAKPDLNPAPAPSAQFRELPAVPATIDQVSASWRGKSQDGKSYILDVYHLDRGGDIYMLPTGDYPTFTAQGSWKIRPDGTVAFGEHGFGKLQADGTLCIFLRLIFSYS